MAAPHPKACALITGAARRLGRAIALALAQSGWQIGVHFNESEEDALAVVAEIEALGGGAAAFQADLARTDELAPLVQSCTDRLGPVTCLVNNAASFENDEAHNFDAQSWAMHHDVNLRAPVFLTQAFAKALPEDAEGNVINFLDQKVRALDLHYFTYTIAKSALWTATKTLAQALAPHNRVNGIAPGPVLPFTGQSAEDFERECRDTLLQRAVPIGDITAAVRFQLETRSITGQMIALNGGRHLNWRPPPVSDV